MSETNRLRSRQAAKLGRFVDEAPIAGRPLVGVALFLLISVGFAMRIANIGEYGFSFDEAQFVWGGAADTIAEILELEAEWSPHPPAIFLIVHGILQFTWDPFWLRLPMVLCGTLLIPATYAFGRSLLGRSAGLAMAGLVAFSPALVELSRVCRNYMPGFLLLVLSLLFLVGFVRTGRMRALAVSGAAAALAVSWHYALLVAFGAMGLLLVSVLLHERAPFRRWLMAAACQLPWVVAFGLLYLHHIAQLPDRIFEAHERWHAANLGFSLADPIGPLEQVWGYLAPAATVFPLTLLTLSGAFVLAIRRRWLALAICGMPWLAAYTFMAVGALPLGGSRHSSYLFIFSFGLVGAHAPELLEGYRKCVTAIASVFGREWSLSAPSQIPGALVATLGFVFFAAASLVEFAEGRPEFIIRSGTAYGSELVSYYTRDQIERSFSLIEERAGPDDLVLLNLQGLFSLRMRNELGPWIRPAEQQERVHDFQLALHRRPLRTTSNGVTFYYSFEVGFQPTPAGLRAGADDVRAVFDLPEPERVWTIRNGWEHPLTLGRPELAYDREIDRLSGGWVLSIPAERLPTDLTP